MGKKDTNGAMGQVPSNQEEDPLFAQGPAGATRSKKKASWQNAVRDTGLPISQGPTTFPDGRRTNSDQKNRDLNAPPPTPRSSAPRSAAAAMGKVQAGEEGDRKPWGQASNVGIGPWSTRSGTRACDNEDDVESHSSEVAAQAAAGAGVTENDMEGRSMYTIAKGFDLFVRIMLWVDVLCTAMLVKEPISYEELIILCFLSSFVNKKWSTAFHGVMHFFMKPLTVGSLYMIRDIIQSRFF